ncbi:MAG: hypothetical protein PUC59_09795 [Firmicutes bacterium]|nr:hypothetical protein [Bacillota bacterium]
MKKAKENKVPKLRQLSGAACGKEILRLCSNDTTAGERSQH